MFRKYTAEEFKTLLTAIDQHLKEPAEMILIGGAAALLAYKATRLTEDIDSFNNISAMKSAYEQAKKDTGLQISVSQTGVADAPYNFEDRLTIYKGIKLKKLVIKIPEIHDLILMKTIRGYEHDLDVIEEISKKNDIDKGVLIRRFETEMDHVIGDRRTLELNFAATLSRAFDEASAEKWIATRRT